MLSASKPNGGTNVDGNVADQITHGWMMTIKALGKLHSQGSGLDSETAQLMRRNGCDESRIVGQRLFNESLVGSLYSIAKIGRYQLSSHHVDPKEDNVPTGYLVSIVSTILTKKYLAAHLGTVL